MRIDDDRPDRLIFTIDNPLMGAVWTVIGVLTTLISVLADDKDFDNRWAFLAGSITLLLVGLWMLVGRTRFDFDRGAGSVTIYRRSLLGRETETLALNPAMRLRVEGESGDVHRISGLVFHTGMETAEGKPRTITLTGFSRGRSDAKHRIAGSVNRWLGVEDTA